jgi:3'-phosphoadenosine 5'-phosphosulfate sulfotransferase (PAPS reductase)/FAD synthetase
MKALVGFSGGKDSLASLIWAIDLYGLKNVEAVFCDTKWEHELTYRHIEEVTQKLGVKLITLTTDKFDGFLGMVEKKGRFPSTKARFCTEELKTKPMIDYVLSQTEHCIIIQGIRSDESFSRSLMKDACRYFRYYFEPYGKDKNGKDKYHTYRKKDIKKWCSLYADDVIRPCFNWTAQQVIDYILTNGLKPNPLYYMGMSRVGCMPCIMAKHGEIKEISKRFPDHIEKIKQAEIKYGSSMFGPDKIPDRFCSNEVLNKKGETVKFPNIEDVVKYVNRNDNNEIDFKEPGGDHSCMSFYGICE